MADMTADYRKRNGWPKLLREAHGLRVKTKRAINNGYVTIPSGYLGTIETHNNGWHLLIFVGDPCNHCGVKPRCSRLGPRDFDLVEESSP